MAVSDEQLRQARQVAAEIVATHDPKYAPYFEILDTEMKRRQARYQLIHETVANTDAAKLRAQRRKRRKNRLE